NIFLNWYIVNRLLTPQNILCTDIDTKRLNDIKQKYGVRVSESNVELTEQSDIIFLAVPPKVALNILKEIAPALTPEKIIISLVASVFGYLQRKACDERAPLVRFIPNANSMVGAGLNLLVVDESINDRVYQTVVRLIEPLGKFIKVSDKKANAFTALTAVGPTFILPIMQELAECLVAETGISPEESFQIIAELFSGTAELVRKTRKPPDELKLLIGLRMLDEAEARPLFNRAYTEAKNTLDGVLRKILCGGE
ncbi:prephenate dehydrogenase/arogenate dehydrogenase family protein, partial [Candidatus Sumerlaeota bacterium]|nr:prephenate dehydrogenase/arogenate dehydrogenase family protein [Candidatus Sumerlaeota bacterium]